MGRCRSAGQTAVSEAGLRPEQRWDKVQNMTSIDITEDGFDVTDVNAKSAYRSIAIISPHAMNGKSGDLVFTVVMH